MLIDPKMTVAEILSVCPAARAPLATLGLDACCGGKHPLEFACRAHGVPVETALAAIERAASAASTPGIDPSMSVREVLAKFPATVVVFERHGLMGCGGAAGPAEPLGWFAKVHHVDPDTLLLELREAAASPVPAPERTATKSAQAAVNASQADGHENLYRRFLKAAFLFTFTGGATLGAWALIDMALRGRLGGLGRGIIQVHGHYQLFGWVALFVVGIAYHILPRMTGIPLPSYRAASLSFVLLVGGTILRTAQALDPSELRTGLLATGALAELAGCALFAWTIARILRAQAGAWQPYQHYLLLGTGWLIVSSILNLAHVTYLAVRSAAEVPPHLNLPFLTVFLVGFVISWILGVSLRTLPVFMGLKANPRLAAALPIPLAASTALLAVGEGIYLADGSVAGRILFGCGGLGLAAAFLLFVRAVGILGASGETEPGLDRRYEKFIRLGYAWLAISALMLAAFSLLALAGYGMDHALVGAYRHALTVGFITTIMIGMAARIVPVFRGVGLHSPLLLEATFWLLAAGNLIRVLFQSLSAAYGPTALRIAGLSGILELAALLLFGYNLWRTLDAATVETPKVSWLPPVAAATKVGDLLLAYPGLLPVFVSHGFTALANPVMRRTVARQVSLGQACRMHGVDLERFLKELSETAGRLRAQS
ncbi:MAG TPA: DUF542 domain-containing protein [Candidatus Polarisedimenticolia bacterium]|nr:DUF542 domain-containing protein [Candidatus Polarisedimenticolia bacterium]